MNKLNMKIIDLNISESMATALYQFPKYHQI